MLRNHHEFDISDLFPTFYLWYNQVSAPNTKSKKSTITVTGEVDDLQAKLLCDQFKDLDCIKFEAAKFKDDSFSILCDKLKDYKDVSDMLLL